jgi:hypothetical protein
VWPMCIRRAASSINSKIFVQDAYGVPQRRLAACQNRIERSAATLDASQVEVWSLEARQPRLYKGMIGIILVESIQQVRRSDQAKTWYPWRACAIYLTGDNDGDNSRAWSMQWDCLLFGDVRSFVCPTL